jgi:uncharacterized protein YjbJ (UPF0337 family)
MITIKIDIQNLKKGKSGTMEKLNINGNWDKKRKNLKKKFAALTDDDLQYTEGEEEELIRRIQQRLDVPKEIAQKIIYYV